MAKDPAFLFYPGDWSGGTITLSRHLKGCYIDLLVAQFNSGALSLEEIKIVLGNDFAAWGTLSKKFKKTEQGLFFNERLESEKTKRKEFSIKQKERVEKRWNKDGILPGNTVVLPLENRNENESKKSLKGRAKKEFIPPTLEEFKAYCKQEGYDSIAEQAYKGYSVADWHDAKGDKVLNWKQKLQNGWFRNSNKNEGSKKNIGTTATIEKGNGYGKL